MGEPAKRQDGKIQKPFLAQSHKEPKAKKSAWKRETFFLADVGGAEKFKGKLYRLKFSVRSGD
jgi:hypothetical protein